MFNVGDKIKFSEKFKQDFKSMCSMPYWKQLTDESTILVIDAFIDGFGSPCTENDAEYVVLKATDDITKKVIYDITGRDWHSNDWNADWFIST